MTDVVDISKERRTRRGRASVPALATATSSTALDELTGDVPRLVTIELDRIEPHPDNPRRDVGDVTELAADIAANGLDQALVVVPHPERADRYRVVIGHRRRAAALEAGVVALPCRIRTDLSPAQQRQMMVRENVHRADLTVVEEADAYQAMLDIDGLTVDGIASAVSRSRSTVRSRLRVARLPEKARTAVHRHTISLDDALALADVPAAEQGPLLKALGTPNFASAMAKVRDRLAVSARMKPLLDVLSAANAPELKRDEYAAPDGATRAGYASPGDVAEFAEQIASEIGPGWSWRWYWGSIYVYRPLTLEEAEAQAALAEQAAHHEAEREQREATARAEREASEEFARVTAATRGEFLMRLLHERKSLTKDQQAAVVGYVATTLVLAPWSGMYIGGTLRGEVLRPKDTDLATWLQLDHGLDLKALGYGERQTVLEEPVTAAAATLSPHQRLLAALAAGIEPLSGDTWRWESRATHVLRWYELLELLGYVPSDDERAALTAPEPS